MKKLSFLLITTLLSLPGLSQVSDDWGKWNGKDTVRIQLSAKPYYKYMSKKARVTSVMLVDNKQCGLHGLSININPFAKSVGLSYDYLAGQHSKLGYYFSVEFHGDWHGSETPSWTEFSKPEIPENTIDTWYTSGKQEKCDPDPCPWHPPVAPCVPCPECPPCEPEYIYITEYVYVHDTTWVHIVEHHYIPPDETEITADNRITTSVGLNYRPSFIPLWVSAGVALHAYTYGNEFVIPFGDKKYKPITAKIGVMYLPVERVLLGINVDSYRKEMMFKVGVAF